MRRTFFAAALAGALATIALPHAALGAAATVSVTGEGTISQQPDRATLSVSLISNDDAAQAAVSKNNSIYTAIVGRLASLRVAESDVSTVAFDITFVPKPDPTASYKPPRTGYIVSRRLGISLDNLSLVGRAVDAVVGAGATEIDGVSFGLRDPRAAYAKALAAAMRDAAMQAAALADAAHLHLGAIQRMTTSPRAVATPAPVMRMATAVEPTQIPPSDVQVQATVTVTYDLQP